MIYFLFKCKYRPLPHPLPCRLPRERDALRKMGQIWRRLSNKIHMSFFGLQRKVSPFLYCFPCVWCSLELIVRADVDGLFAEILFLWPLKETHHKSHQFAIVAGPSDMMTDESPRQGGRRGVVVEGHLCWFGAGTKCLHLWDDVAPVTSYLVPADQRLDVAATVWNLRRTVSEPSWLPDPRRKL